MLPRLTRTASAHLELDARSCPLGAHAPGERVQLGRGVSVLRSFDTGAYEMLDVVKARGRWSDDRTLACCTTAPDENGEWRLEDDSTDDASELTVNGAEIARHRGRALADGDVIAFDRVTLRFVVEPDDPRAFLAGVRRFDGWTLFTSYATDLCHALSDDGVLATASARAVLVTASARGTALPEARARFVDADGRAITIVDDVGGVPLADLVAALHARGDVLDAGIAVAMLRAYVVSADHGASPGRLERWLTFDGRLPVIAWLDSGRLGPPPCAYLAHSFAPLFGVESDLAWLAHDPAEAQRAIARARDERIPAGPLADGVRALLDVAVRGGTTSELAPALAQLEGVAGTPSPGFIAALLADALPRAVERERRIRDDALTLGARELARRFGADGAAW